MQIVIDIPNKKWELIQNGDYCGIIDDLLFQNIKNGTPLPKCKDCKYFEYDSVARVNGIPLIVAHEICEKWGNGCKTSEDGYCFMFEGKE